jgi:hypothetical protein
MALRNHKGELITPPFVGETTYEYDYFSGSQINVMFGDVVIDSAVAVSFNAVQQKTPVWGYASQYYSFVGEGKVVVQGAIMLAFKESGYLSYPMIRYQNLKLGGEWTTPRYTLNKEGRLTKGYRVGDTPGTFLSAAREAEKHKTMKANVEQSMEWAAAKDKKNAQQAYNQFFRDLGNLPDDRFEQWAEVFEDAIWYGSDTANPLLRERLFSKNLPEDQLLATEDALSHRRADQYPPIDIWIVYGDTSKPSANHTVKKLMDVSFTGQSQSIEVSGEPILEEFQFIARNIV